MGDDGYDSVDAEEERERRGSPFGGVEAKEVTEYQPKIHFLRNGNTICETQNAKAGTETESEVTCLRCQKLLERAEELESRGLKALLYNVSITSPRITQNGKNLLQEWLALLPENVKLTFNHDYSAGTTLTASWTEARD